MVRHHRPERRNGELALLSEVQRSLLPPELPAIPSVDLAAYYQPAAEAGGDYYDFFPLADGTWGILIADACGHGGAAALGMAATRTLAHAFGDAPTTPNTLLEYLNHHLTPSHRSTPCSFVTAFFSIYDPETRELSYSSAGHPSPRVKRCRTGCTFRLDGPRGLPLGVLREQRYAVTRRQLRPGDQIAFFTDGIVEASNRDRQMFGARLDGVLRQCRRQASSLLETLVMELDAFTDVNRPIDDRTLIVARITA